MSNKTVKSQNSNLYCLWRLLCSSQFSILLVLLFSFNAIVPYAAFGQKDDTRSKKIIDDMTAKFKTFQSVSLDFSVNILQLQDNSETNMNGKIWIKNDKYKLEIPEYVIYFDGSKIYQYLPEVNEVNITQPDPNESDEDFQLLNPQTYFNISSKTFKTNFLKEGKHDNRTVLEIDLYPIDFSGSKYIRIRMMVEKTTMQLTYLKAIMKDGTHYTLSFKPYTIHQTALRDSFFVFNKGEHPNVEVIDLTF